MIDIDACLLASEQNTPLWVYFKDPGKEGDKIGFEIKPDPKKQRKLVNRSVRISTALNNENSGEMYIVADWFALALDLVEFMIGWEGFNGEFNREKVKLWFEKFPSYAIAFAQNFKDILDEYENALVKRKDAEVKN